jgi:hypothetical protein
MEQAPGRTGGLLGRIFAIDLRALAALRIALALLLLCDLGSRCQWLRAHYSDDGVLPRQALLERYDHHWFWSLHLLSGAWQVEALLFAIAALVAGAMLVGYRTRLSTVLSWVLLASLQTRNPLVLQGGDVLLRCLMFWAMFLPLGARWSLDRSWGGSDPPPRAITSIATAALMLQVCLVYWCTGILKNNPIWTTDHTAIQYALSLGAFATPFGVLLLHAPTVVLQGCTASCLMLERFGPFLVLIPLWSGSLRLAVVLMFRSFHLGLALTMRLGPFPYICIAAWLAFLPSWAFDAIGARLALGRGLALVAPPGPEDWLPRLGVLRWLLALPRAEIRAASGAELTGSSARQQGATLMVTDAGGTISRGAGALRTCLLASPWAWPFAGLLSRPAAWRSLVAVGERLVAPLTQLERLLRPPRLRAAAVLHPAAAVACGVSLVLVALWNLRGVAPQVGRIFMPNSWDPVVQVVRLDQHWNMFAPFPTRTDIWYSAPGKLRGGGQIDLLTGTPLADQPPSISDMPFYGNERWRKYLANLREKENQPVLTYFAQYLYRQWNEQHLRMPAQQVVRVDIRLWSRTTHLDHDDPYLAHELWYYEPGHGHPPHARQQHAPIPPTPVPLVAQLPGAADPRIAASTTSAPVSIAPVPSPVALAEVGPAVAPVPAAAGPTTAMPARAAAAPAELVAAAAAAPPAPSPAAGPPAHAGGQSDPAPAGSAPRGDAKAAPLPPQPVPGNAPTGSTGPASPASHADAPHA